MVVPVYEGDLEKSFSSMALWPKVCSQETLAMMDLVMYKAEGENEQSRNSLPIALEDTAGRCFANTKVVYANLADEVSRDITYVSITIQLESARLGYCMLKNCCSLSTVDYSHIESAILGPLTHVRLIENINLLRSAGVFIGPNPMFLQQRHLLLSQSSKSWFAIRLSETCILPMC